MAVSRVNTASITGSGTTTAVATIPGGTGIQAGDVLIVCGNSNTTAHVANGASCKDSVNGTNFTTILETQLGSSSTRWQQSFVFQTTVAIADGSTITFTGQATGATASSLSVDVFRGATTTIDQAAVGSSNVVGTTSAAPALGANATAGALVLTFCSDGSGSLTAGSPFTAGSTISTTPSTGIGFVLSASGSSTYASTWTLGVSNTSAAQTVSFQAAPAGGGYTLQLTPPGLMSPAAWISLLPGPFYSASPPPPLVPLVAISPRRPQPLPRLQRSAASKMMPILAPPVTPIILVNSANGGTSGTTVTTGNSGGSSGNAFNTVSIGSGATVAYDNTHAAHDGLGFQIATGVTAVQARVQWNASMGTQTQVWYRGYYYFTSTPTITTFLLDIKQSTTLCAQVVVQTNGTLQVRTTGGTQTLTTTTTIPTNAWFRIEGFVTGNGISGQVELKIFLTMDSTTATEVKTSSTSVNTGGAPDNYSFGCSTNTANLGPYWMDDLGLSNTGYLGPVIVPSVLPVFLRAPSVQAKILSWRTRPAQQFIQAPPAVIPPTPPQSQGLRARILSWRTRPQQQTAPPRAVPSPASQGQRARYRFGLRARLQQSVPLAAVQVPVSQGQRSRYRFGLRARPQLQLPRAVAGPAQSARNRLRFVQARGRTASQGVPPPVIPRQSQRNQARPGWMRARTQQQFLQVPPVAVPPTSPQSQRLRARIASWRTRPQQQATPPSAVIVPPVIQVQGGSRARLLGFRSRSQRAIPLGAPRVPAPQGQPSRARLRMDRQLRRQQSMPLAAPRVPVPAVQGQRARFRGVFRQRQGQAVPSRPLLPLAQQRPVRGQALRRSQHGSQAVPAAPAVIASLPLASVRTSLQRFVTWVRRRPAPQVVTAPTGPPVRQGSAALSAPTLMTAVAVSVEGLANLWAAYLRAKEAADQATQLYIEARQSGGYAVGTLYFGNAYQLQMVAGQAYENWYAAWRKINPAPPSEPPQLPPSFPAM